MEKGMIFAFYAAVVSGFSVFVNGMAVKAVPNAYFFTTAKNVVVALLFAAMILGISKRKDIVRLKKKDWFNLFGVGLIGGSIPFLLFFKGMSLSTQAAVNGAFIHKTLFIWVAILALTFLKEKFSFLQYTALGIIMVGILMIGGPKNLSFGAGEWMIFAATLLWAFEAVFVKKLMKKYDTQILALGRMFFGSLIMVAFLIYTGNFSPIISLGSSQISWIVITSVLLFFYVNFYFMALKHERAVVVTSILTLAFPLTIIFQNLNKNIYSPGTFFTAVPIVLGIATLLFMPNLPSALKKKINSF